MQFKALTFLALAAAAFPTAVLGQAPLQSCNSNVDTAVGDSCDAGSGQLACASTNTEVVSKCPCCYFPFPLPEVSLCHHLPSKHGLYP